MAPILAFTAEEAWSHMDGRRGEAGEDSVLFRVWHDVPEPGDAATLVDRWGHIRAFRGLVTKRLEEARAAGQIGSSLQAEVDVYAAEGRYQQLKPLGDELRFALITSQARLHAASSEADERIEVRPSHAKKCDRCWHYRDDVGVDAAHPTVCGRCVDNLSGRGETRRFV